MCLKQTTLHQAGEHQGASGGIRGHRGLAHQGGYQGDQGVATWGGGGGSCPASFMIKFAHAQAGRPGHMP